MTYLYSLSIRSAASLLISAVSCCSCFSRKIPHSLTLL